MTDPTPQPLGAHRLDAGNATGGQPPARAILQQWDCITHTGAWNLGNQSWDIVAPGAKRID